MKYSRNNETNKTIRPRRQGKLMETSINANKYKENPGHREETVARANRCRQLKRNGTGDRKEMVKRKGENRDEVAR